MDSALRETLARRVLDYGAGEMEAIVTHRDTGLTRFTQNAIHQNVAQHDISVRVRSVEDSRTGVAATNDLSEAALRAVVRRSREIAGLAPRDAGFPGLVGPLTTAPGPEAFVSATAATTPAQRAAMAGEIFSVAEAAGLWMAGYVSTARNGVTIANSRGLLASFDRTDCALNVKANSTDSTGYAERYGNDAALLDGTSLGRIAAEKALSSRAPIDVEPGTWTVILEPAAAGELIAFLIEHFSAQAVDEGSSFIGDGLARRYTGENVTITDDCRHPLNPGMPFDYEGAPVQRVMLMEAGVAKNVVTDAYWAAKTNRSNTGHALPVPNATGPGPGHIVLAGGTKSTQQLISETERGLLVSRFWYVRTVDQRRTILTGMTRDGTFLIENGKLTGGVRNMRFNQSVLAALNDAEFSCEQARTGGYSYALVVPSMKLTKFHFSSRSPF